MRRTMLRGRQLGKSTISLEHAILRQQTEAMQKSIDRMIIDELQKFERYNHIKSWRARNGTRMHRIECSDEVWDWLKTEHSQYGVNNPDWWVYDRKINITDKLYSLLVLRWAE